MKMEDAPPAHELPVDIREIQEGALDEVFESENADQELSTKPDQDIHKGRFHGRKGAR